MPARVDRILGRDKPKERWEKDELRVAFWDEHTMVPFPGHYADHGDGPDPDMKVVWVEEVPDDPDHDGGWWELDREFYAGRAAAPKVGRVVPLEAGVHVESRSRA